MTAIERVPFGTPRGHAPRLSERYIPGRRSERYWAEAELDILRRHYADRGADWCAAQLPGRGLAQIYSQANKLGLRRLTRAPKRTPAKADVPALDAQIREAFPELRGRGAVASLADRLGVPRWWLSGRLAAMGLAQPHRKEPPWSEAELALLRRVPLHSPDRCAAIFREHGFARSPTSIVVKSKREGLKRRYRETLSGAAVAEILGLDNKTITSWCGDGLIEATRRESQRLPQQGGAPWSIERAALRRFILDNLERIDIRKVDKFAFVAILTGEAE
jgi:hypothetical protein